jgi:hypothetical protein
MGEYDERPGLLSERPWRPEPTNTKRDTKRFNIPPLKPSRILWNAARHSLDVRQNDAGDASRQSKEVLTNFHSRAVTGCEQTLVWDADCGRYLYAEDVQ